MPRDFVPRLYREYTLQTPRLDVAVLCCDVTELFDICVLGSREPDVVIGPHSHQYVLRFPCPTFGPGDIPAIEALGHLPGMRQAICEEFHAAMAALE